MSVSNAVVPFEGTFRTINEALEVIEKSAELSVIVSEILVSPTESHKLINDRNKKRILEQFKQGLEIVQELKKQVGNLTEAVVEFNASELRAEEV